MGANLWKMLRKDGRRARYAGAAGVAVWSRGSRMRMGYSSDAVVAVRCIIKPTDVMRQQRNTTGGAPRMFARTLRNCSRYG